MGGTWSRDRSPSENSKFLIGDLSELSPATKRLYELGNKCLETVHPNAANRQALHALDSNADQNVSGTSTTSARNSDQGEQRESDQVRPLFEPLQQTQPLCHQQTFSQWRSVRELKNVYSLCMPSQSVVYIQPIDEFPEFIMNFRFKSHGLYMDFFGLLQSFAQVFFSGYDVVVLPPVWLETCGWYITSREHSRTHRKQFLAKDFFKPLQTMMPPGGSAILGLVWTDLYPSEDLNFELGESCPDTKSAVFCFGRFEPATYDPAHHQDVDKVTGALVWKMLKVISHETCHLFGMQHCTFFKCNMNPSSLVADAMSQPLFLCPVCLRKLQQVCHFDVVQRYTAMLGFLSDLQLQLPDPAIAEAINWLQACLRFLGQE